MQKLNPAENLALAQQHYDSLARLGGLSLCLANRSLQGAKARYTAMILDMADLAA
jgi:hypothetical protein